LLNDQISFDHVVCSTDVDRLDVLPSSIRLSTAQLELAHISRGELMLKRVLKDVDGNYDFIMIDCPPTLNLLTLNALCYSTKVIIPVQTHYYALDGMKELLRTVNAVRSQFNPQLNVLGILATLFDKRIRIAIEMLDALRDYFKEEMFQAVINYNVKLIEAPMIQKPVVSYAPNSSAASDFQRLAQEIIHLVTKAD
jgi:chromosome partitioning protein